MARTIEFNREEVLEKAMHTFWQSGYSMTSIPKLVSATQLNPGSIYAAFNSKEGLFIETLSFYGNRSLETLKQFIDEVDSPLTGIENFFGALIDKSSNENQNGCLLVNTLLEMSSHSTNIQDHANKQLNLVEKELAHTLEQAQDLGELSADANPKALAKFLMVNIWGLRVIAKTNSLHGDTQSKEIVLAQIVQSLKE